MESSERIGVLERVQGLKITVGQTAENRFVAYTQQEPLFCFERDTEAEILDQVQATLQSYVTHFGRAGAVVQISQAASAEAGPPVQFSRPVSTLFARADVERERACA